LSLSAGMYAVYRLNSSFMFDAQLGIPPNQLHILSCSNSNLCEELTLSCMPHFMEECFCSHF